MSLTLAQALRVEESTCIAFVGSGGKTTAMFQLARQINPPAIVTATSHLGMWQVSLADRHIVAESPDALKSLQEELNGVVLITGALNGDRTKPVNHDVLDWIHKFCLNHSIPLLIEADGSRQKLLKGWADHEPPIPSFADHIVQVVGLGGLGKPLTEEFVHRPEIFSRLSELKMGERIGTEEITRVLLHPESARKNFPNAARLTVLLNQAHIPELQASARGMAKPLLAGFDSVVIADLKQDKIHAAHERVAGVILAAGESSRFGEPKQLLNWKGEPFVRAVTNRVLEAGLSPVVVVTGANAERVETAVEDLKVKIARNSEWKNGQASSIRAGVLSLTPIHLPASTSPSLRSARAGEGYAGACIFLLVDQPQITVSILQALIEKHAAGLSSIVAPMVLDRRANPVLFDRRTFPDLLILEGDTGGRAIFHKHPVEYLPWHDDRLLLDVDTPEHYQRLIADETV